MDATQDMNVTELHDLIEQRGLLVHRDDSDHVEFQFVYDGFPFVARATAGSRGSEIQIRTALGYLPYTAEGSGRRQGALNVLKAAKKVFGNRVRLQSDMKLVLEDLRSMDGPLTPTNLLTEMVILIVKAKPYLDALEQFMTPLETQQNRAASFEKTAETAS